MREEDGGGGGVEKRGEGDAVAKLVCQLMGTYMCMCIRVYVYIIYVYTYI